MNTRPTKFQLGSPTRQQGVKTDSPPRPKTPAPDKTGRLSIVEKPDQRPTSARTKAPLRRQRAATTLEQTTEGHSTQPGAPTLRGARGENSPPKSPSPSSSRTNERPPHQQDASRDESPKKVGFDRSLYVAGTDKKTGEKAFVHRGQMIPIKDPTPEKRSSQSRSQNARVPISRPKSIGTVVRRPEQDLPPLPFETKLDVIVKRVKKQPRTGSERLSLRMGAVDKNTRPDAKTNLPQLVEVDPSIERKNTAELYNELDSYIEKFSGADDAITSSSSADDPILGEVGKTEEDVVQRAHVIKNEPPIGGGSTDDLQDDATTSSSSVDDRILVEVETEDVVERAYLIKNEPPIGGGSADDLQDDATTSSSSSDDRILVEVETEDVVERAYLIKNEPATASVRKPWTNVTRKGEEHPLGSTIGLRSPLVVSVDPYAGVEESSDISSDEEQSSDLEKSSKSSE